MLFSLKMVTFLRRILYETRAFYRTTPLASIIRPLMRSKSFRALTLLLSKTPPPSCLSWGGGLMKQLLPRHLSMSQHLTCRRLGATLNWDASLVQGSTTEETCCRLKPNTSEPESDSTIRLTLNLDLQGQFMWLQPAHPVPGKKFVIKCLAPQGTHETRDAGRGHRSR